ncbi:MAG: hypothetical protein COW05_05215 [Gammaproteobacteria bacterium CG12_big_fil_rev_8_21_14_0_65_46_12]|nr:MAG: hypothetical protein COW05_05215 [Gammaproteobacteria bacterium CG12_big_fil_rev_8_21_14_0_65_46_12]
MANLPEGMANLRDLPDELVSEIFRLLVLDSGLPALTAIRATATHYRTLLGADVFNPDYEEAFLFLAEYHPELFPPSADSVILREQLENALLEYNPWAYVHCKALANLNIGLLAGITRMAADCYYQHNARILPDQIVTQIAAYVKMSDEEKKLLRYLASINITEVKEWLYFEEANKKARAQQLFGLLVLQEAGNQDSSILKPIELLVRWTRNQKAELYNLLNPYLSEEDASQLESLFKLNIDDKAFRRSAALCSSGSEEYDTYLQNELQNIQIQRREDVENFIAEEVDAIITTGSIGCLIPLFKRVHPILKGDCLRVFIQACTVNKIKSDNLFKILHFLHQLFTVYGDDAFFQDSGPLPAKSIFREVLFTAVRCFAEAHIGSSFLDYINLIPLNAINKISIARIFAELVSDHRGSSPEKMKICRVLKTYLEGFSLEHLRVLFSQVDGDQVGFLGNILSNIVCSWTDLAHFAFKMLQKFPSDHRKSVLLSLVECSPGQYCTVFNRLLSFMRPRVIIGSHQEEHVWPILNALFPDKADLIAFLNEKINGGGNTIFGEVLLKKAVNHLDIWAFLLRFPYQQLLDFCNELSGKFIQDLIESERVVVASYVLKRIRGHGLLSPFAECLYDIKAEEPIFQWIKDISPSAFFRLLAIEHDYGRNVPWVLYANKKINLNGLVTLLSRLSIFEKYYLLFFQKEQVRDEAPKTLFDQLAPEDVPLLMEKLFAQAKYSEKETFFREHLGRIVLKHAHRLLTPLLKNLTLSQKLNLAAQLPPHTQNNGEAWACIFSTTREDLGKIGEVIYDMVASGKSTHANSVIGAVQGYLKQTDYTRAKIEGFWGQLCDLLYEKISLEHGVAFARYVAASGAFEDASRLKNLVYKELSPGEYFVLFSAKDSSGRSLFSRLFVISLRNTEVCQRFIQRCRSLMPAELIFCLEEVRGLQDLLESNKNNPAAIFLQKIWEKFRRQSQPPPLGMPALPDDRFLTSESRVSDNRTLAESGSQRELLRKSCEVDRQVERYLPKTIKTRQSINRAEIDGTANLAKKKQLIVQYTRLALKNTATIAEVKGIAQQVDADFKTCLRQERHSLPRKEPGYTRSWGLIWMMIKCKLMMMMRLRGREFLDQAVDKILDTQVCSSLKQRSELTQFFSRPAQPTNHALSSNHTVEIHSCP